MDSVVVYRQSSDSTQMLSANNGYLVPVADRAFPFYQTSIVPITIPTLSRDYYYFHVINHTTSGKNVLKSSIRMGFVGYTDISFKKWYDWGLSFNYFTAGMMLFIAALNFLLYFTTSARNYFFLAVNNLGYLTWIVIFGGMLINFEVLTDLTLEREVRLLLPPPLITLTYSIYAVDFLDLRQHFPVFFKIFISVLIIHSAMMVLHIVGFHEIAYLVSQLFAPFIYFSVLICAYILWKRGYDLIKYFFLACLVFTIGVVVFLIAYNVPNINYLIGHYFAQACFILEVLLFSAVTFQKFINMQSENIAIKTRETVLENELNHKNRQITSMIALKINKNNKLVDLKRRLDGHNMDRQLVASFKKDIDDMLSFDTSWEDFKVHFEGVHPTFFDKLQSAFGPMTTNELRLAAFIKMNLKNKEIASITAISLRSVEKAKERLKKKMNVEKISQTIKHI